MKRIFWISTLFVLLGTTIAYPQSRNVIWVHGFNGDASALQHYESIFTQERRINSMRQGYSTTDGLNSAATQLNTSVQNHYGVNATNSTNLAIGHSMGGTMIREVDRTASQKKFGGYITIASPNYGAPVSASILNGDVNSAAETAVDRLTTGPLSELLGLPWLIISGWTTSKVSNLFLEGVEYLKPATNQDLKEGSAAMTALNNYNSTAQRISIIAQENSPVHWRMISSQIFGDDSELSCYISSIRGVYNSRYNDHHNLGVINLFLNPAASVYHYALANQWKLGRDWIDDSETIWCTLIKATKVERVSRLIWEWIPCAPIALNSVPSQPLRIQPMANKKCDYWEVREVYSWETVNYPNDGLIPTYAQELVGVSSNSRYTIDYANHLELKNMSNSRKPDGTPNDGTGNTLRAIFDRPSGTWFHTPRR